MAYLGQTVVVKLPSHVAERYNAEYPGNNPIEAGTERPGVVVALDDTAELANVLLYHDGPQMHYVQNVPVSVLTGAGDSPVKAAPSESEKTDSDDSETVQGRPFDQALVGNGTTFEGPGDERPAKPEPADQSPKPGEVVSGVPNWNLPTTPSTDETAPSNADLWEADTKE